MKEELIGFNSNIEQHWVVLVNKVPEIILAIIILFVGSFIIKLTSKYSKKIIEKRAADSIVTRFLVNMISIVLAIFLTSICLGILGLGNITDKLLAGTAITTFIVGYALKDIGENFLAGILMAFRRPFKIGDLIEVQKIRGKVKEMSLRETIIQTLDGKDVFIPNSIILKNPLENYTYHQLLKGEFSIEVHITENLEKIMADLLSTIKSFQEVEQQPTASVSVMNIDKNLVTISCAYWFKTTDISAPGGSLKSLILIKTITYLKDHKIRLTDEKIDPEEIEQQISHEE